MSSRTNKNSAVLFLAVVSLSSFLFFFKLGDRSFRNPDEGRYAAIAKEMVLRNDWVEPRLYGVDYLKKPILFYWLLALSFKIFGFSEFAARLVPALFGILGVCMTFFFAKRVFDANVAFCAALILTTNFWYLQVGRYLLIDMTFSFLVVAALYSFYLARIGDRRRKVYNLLFYVSVSLAFLTKGVIGIVIPGMAVVLTMITRRQLAKLLSHMNLAMGALIFALIVLPWFVLISLKEPEFIRVFFFHEHWARFVSSQFEHQERWYYYFLAVPVLLLPWTLFVVPLIRSLSVFKDKAARAPHVFLLGSALGLVIFFSLSKSKLPTYILPCIPLFSVFLGYAWAQSNAKKLFYTLITAMVLVSIPIAYLMEKFNADYTTKPFAEALQPRLSADDLVFVYDHPGPFYDFRFYLDHPVKLVGLEGEFRYLDDDLNARLAKDEKESWISREEFYEMLRQGKKLYCLIRRSDFSEMDPEILKQTLIVSQDERKILFQTKP